MGALSKDYADAESAYHRQHNQWGSSTDMPEGPQPAHVAGVTVACLVGLSGVS